jgi:uncharacterized membrane protein
MAHAENTITIDRPVKEVFDFILDGDNNPSWRPGVADIKRITNKPDAVGAKFKQGMKGPTGRIDADYEIVKCDPNVLIEFRVTAGPARPTGSYKFASRGKSTEVTFILDFQPKGLAKLMEPMINKQMGEEVSTLSNLKAYLEAKR